MAGREQVTSAKAKQKQIKPIRSGKAGPFVDFCEHSRHVSRSFLRMCFKGVSGVANTLEKGHDFVGFVQALVHADLCVRRLKVKRADKRCHLFDLILNFQCCSLDIEREIPNFVCNDRKAAPSLSRSRSFDRSIECQKIGLKRHIPDALYRGGHFFSLRVHTFNLLVLGICSDCSFAQNFDQFRKLVLALFHMGQYSRGLAKSPTRSLFSRINVCCDLNDANHCAGHVLDGCIGRLEPYRPAVSAYALNAITECLSSAQVIPHVQVSR